MIGQQTTCGVCMWIESGMSDITDTSIGGMAMGVGLADMAVRTGLPLCTVITRICCAAHAATLVEALGAMIEGERES